MPSIRFHRDRNGRADYIGQTCLVGVLGVRGERLEIGPEGRGANRRDWMAGVMRESGRLQWLRQAVAGRRKGGNERLLWEDYGRPGTPNSTIGRTIPLLGGTSNDNAAGWS